jgi:hypothetical protein
MAQAKRHLLSCKACLPGTWLQFLQARELVALTALGKGIVQLELNVEVILDDSLVAPRHEDKVLNSGLSSLIHDILDDGLVNDSQHFLWNGLGSRQKSRAESSYRENCFPYFFHIANYPFRSCWPALPFVTRPSIVHCHAEIEEG